MDYTQQRSDFGTAVANIDGIDALIDSLQLDAEFLGKAATANQAVDVVEMIRSASVNDSFQTARTALCALREWEAHASLGEFQFILGARADRGDGHYWYGSYFSNDRYQRPNAWREWTDPQETHQQLVELGVSQGMSERDVNQIIEKIVAKLQNAKV
ncbi:hypothetical protein [Streptomyces sp. NBC_01264]|uniref:hypothetical protein n=1 Tax=Streptomyces sp. NBC_01264 TaxID=2903804 RepID=UPI002251531B|nr:hypothetical protein [Streptomyces sp. NBC_01264]MCX4781937.1 hypothetical protein [Streptomyces sp. NBC_01264]